MTIVTLNLTGILVLGTLVSETPTHVTVEITDPRYLGVTGIITVELEKIIEREVM